MRRVLVPALHFHRRCGLEIYTWELAASLRRLGWEPEVLACLQSGTTRREGFAHTGLAPADVELRESHTERWPEALADHLAARSADEEFVLAAHPFTLPQVGPYARNHGLPLVTIFYGVEAWDLYDSLRREIETEGTVVAISRYTADAIERQARPAAGPVRILPPAIDTARFHPGPKPDRSPLVLLTVSRLSMRDWFKGHRTVIETLPWLCEQLQEPVEYWIAGEGPYARVLRQHAVDHGVGDRVRFLGFVPGGELPDLYRRADLHVMPSELGRQDDGMASGEGFGIVFAEAAACGTPSVGLSHAGASEALADGISGVTVPDPQSIGAAILDLLRDRDARIRLGARGAEWARRSFGYASFDSTLGEILEDALPDA